MTILLTGKNGQLGYELHQRLQNRYDVIALGRDEVDFCDTQLLHDMLHRLPELSLIINAAAYTDVDKAEREPLVTELVNVEAPAILATEADRRNIPIIHFSTSYVFDGQRDKSYVETDHVNPLSIYGWSKLAGEQRVLELCEKVLVFRLSSVYGTRRRNFLTTMLGFIKNHEIPRVVDDQRIAPTWCPMIADALEHVVSGIMAMSKISWGVYHLCSTGSVRCHAFATEIFKCMSNVTGAEVPLPVPVSTEEFGAKATRPACSVLDCRKFMSHFDYILPDWKMQLIHCMNSLKPEDLLAFIANLQKK